MITVVEGTYPGLSWDIAPTEKDGKIILPTAEVKVAGNTYQMAASSFDAADGTVYLTPDGYVFVAKDKAEASLKKFSNHENYWVCSISISDGKTNIMALKAVKS